MVEALPAGLAFAAVVTATASVALWLRGRRRVASFCHLPVPVALAVVAVVYRLGPAPEIRPAGRLLFALLLAWTALLLWQAGRGKPLGLLFWSAVLVDLALAAGLGWLGFAFRIF
ncbi:MAG: hypothetical protein AB1832_08010 [Pseudomonadota bacterium]